MKCHTCGHRVRKGVVYNGNFVCYACAITLSELYMKMLEERIKILEELIKSIAVERNSIRSI